MERASDGSTTVHTLATGKLRMIGIIVAVINYAKMSYAALLNWVIQVILC